jgi:hypothetical protein
MQKRQSSQSQHNLSPRDEAIRQEVDSPQTVGEGLDVPLPDPDSDLSVTANSVSTTETNAIEELEDSQQSFNPKHPDVREEKNAARTSKGNDAHINDINIKPGTNWDNQYR